MKFCTFTLIDNSPDPITGERLTTAERFAAVVRQAQWAEELGFDGFGVGERHAQRFISSAPPVVLAYIAASTSKIRLLTTVTVLSLLDPVRVAEDYATLDQLSGGRLDVIIGKGNDPDQNALFGYDIDGQWDRNAEKYELLRRLLREENVTWSGDIPSRPGGGDHPAPTAAVAAARSGTARRHPPNPPNWRPSGAIRCSPRTVFTRWPSTPG